VTVELIFHAVFELNRHDGWHVIRSDFMRHVALRVGLLRSRRIDAVQEFSHGGRAMIHRIELDVDFLEVTQRHDDGDYLYVKMCVLLLHPRSC